MGGSTFEGDLEEPEAGGLTLSPFKLWRGVATLALALELKDRSQNLMKKLKQIHTLLHQINADEQKTLRGLKAPLHGAF